MKMKAFLICFLFCILFLHISISGKIESEEKRYQLHALGVISALESRDNDVAFSAIQNSIFLEFPFKNDQVIKKMMPWIDGMISSGDVGKQRLALDTISRFRSYAKKYLDQITPFLKVENESVKLSAIQALGKLYPLSKASSSQIGTFLKDDVASLREAALNAMGNMETSAVPYISIIIDLLKDRDSWVSDAAIEAIGSLKDVVTPFIPKIILLLNHNDLWTRTAAAEAISRIGSIPDRDIYRIKALLKSRRKGTVMAAVIVLGKLKLFFPQDINRLARFFNDEDSWVRIAAVGALGNTKKGAKQYIPKLLKFLNNDNPWLQQSTVKTLGNLGDLSRPYLFHIKKYLTHPKEDVRVDTVLALQKILRKEPSMLYHLLKPVLNDRAALVRKTAIRVIGQMDGVTLGDCKQLTHFLNDVSVMVRKAAVIALGKHPDLSKRSYEKIRLLLDDKNIFVRMAAARTLLNMDTISARDYSEIFMLLEIKRIRVRREVVKLIYELEERVGENPWCLVTPIFLALHSYPSFRSDLIFFIHIAGVKDPTILITLQWLGVLTPKYSKNKVTKIQVKEILQGMKGLWEQRDSFNDLKLLLEDKVIQLISIARWKAKDIQYLKKQSVIFNNIHIDEKIVKEIEIIDRFHWVSFLIQGLTLHAIIWIMLLLFYQRSPRIQQVFFWNPTVRAIAGLMYIEIVLTHLPFFRKRLLIPFKQYLLRYNRLKKISEEQFYNEKSQALLSPDQIDGRKKVDLNQGMYENENHSIRAIEQFKGSTLLVGEGGTGKTMLIKSLLSQKKVSTVYLLAQWCAKGVFKAIRDQLKGVEVDYKFLRKIILSGGCEIYIDDLNEVDVYTDMAIKSFAEKHPKIKIVMITRPTERAVPGCVNILTMSSIKKEKQF